MLGAGARNAAEAATASGSPPRWRPPGTFVEAQSRYAATAHTPASAAKVASRSGCHMRVAVISDIHANSPRSRRRPRRSTPEAPDAIWWLGDLVGYGARPNECCASSQAHCRGLARRQPRSGVLGAIDLEDFAGDAAAAARVEPQGARRRGARHSRPLAPIAAPTGSGSSTASPRDPIWEYVLTVGGGPGLDPRRRRQVDLVGHSHVPLAIARPRLAEGGVAPGGTDIDSTPVAGCSTPARSASRGTATRGGLARARPRPRDGRVPAGPVRRRRDAGRDRRGRACPPRSPSGSRTERRRSAWRPRRLRLDPGGLRAEA